MAATKTTPDRRASVWWRIGFAILAAIYALACLQSAYDRLSAKQPMTQRAVIGPFRSHADVAAARLALAQNDPAIARAYAVRAIANRPIDAAPVGLLGAALILEKDGSGADRAFRIAAAGGWRDKLTQLYWTDQTIALGDWPLAAARLDALLRANPDLPEADAYRARFIADPRGRQELARLLAQKPDWLRTVLDFDADTEPAMLAQRIALLDEVARQGKPIGCEAIRPMVDGLLARQLLAEADAAWRGQCRSGGSIAGLGDPGLDRVGTNDPAGWTLHSSADLDSDIIPDGDGKALVVGNSGTSSQLVLSQPVIFTTPWVRIAWDAQEGERKTDRVDVALNCGPPQRPGMDGGADRVVRVPDCPYQILSVWISPDSGKVTMRRVGKAGRGMSARR